MARPEVTGRKGPRRADKIARPGKSVAEFCQAYGISRATFYAWKAAGIAPAVTQPAGPRGWQIITEASEAAWREMYTTIAAAIEGAG
jgi:hypothetical protein